MISGKKLTARVEQFDSFWEAPKDIEKGYVKLSTFYKRNYMKYITKDKSSSILVVSCGPGYFVNLLRNEGYTDVLGIDSDPRKLEYAKKAGLNCGKKSAFIFLEENRKPYDVIIVEQEINHLTKEEIIEFLNLCRENLKENGMLVVHSMNGSNPITGAEAVAQNIDHFNAFTEYSLRQILEYANFKEIKVIPLNLYVFYENPLNYIGLMVEKVFTAFFRFSFIIYGKSNKIFTKKIAAVCKKKQISVL